MILESDELNSKARSKMIEQPLGILGAAAVAASGGAATGWLVALFVDWLGMLI